jgi:hypothetical protein
MRSERVKKSCSSAKSVLEDYYTQLGSMLGKKDCERQKKLTLRLEEYLHIKGTELFHKIVYVTTSH